MQNKLSSVGKYRLNRRGKAGQLVLTGFYFAIEQGVVVCLPISEQLLKQKYSRLIYKTKRLCKNASF